jgi:hypothetical protein
LHSVGEAGSFSGVGGPNGSDDRINQSTVL